MLIDWFTVIAQAFNFLVLVWLLKRFLYAPILNAIDTREKRIAAELSDADAKKSEAQTEREDFRRKNEVFDELHAGLLKKATADAAAEREHLMEAARSEAGSLQTRQQKQLMREYQSLNDEIARRTQAEVFAIARKTLADLADVGLEQRMVEVFIQRLQALDVFEKQRLAALTQSTPVLVRSAFELSSTQRASIEGAIRKNIVADTPVGFDTVPDLMSGIELIMQGQKVAWSISDYLFSLEKIANELLKNNPDSKPK